ncbi:molybdopterin-synthase adenylyltransferase MoeB [Quadrisphaera sp. DSM 44207]|uniref:molybdopterin-synthase adenylyltransferase MoeB n=1 Tax=Quadrisphaera sp. DSM 44207 TaxID=1881057 RepID=UPI00088EF9BF|nr:molybdopterin-synthase adenylyltransferase MoeB [Quadrisphaera sp. DSM 44207]SDQ78784.1 adenylyltransferase and sulfurtransferase [Quadrisphaera sp. DSM 44207]
MTTGAPGATGASGAARTTGVLPPLVEPAPELTPEEARRYVRHLQLPEVGHLGQRRLKAARVLVVGAGGLGSPALLYLAAAGVGTIGVLDDDLVEESNLQRQVVHGSGDVGRAKVDSAARAVERTNPLVRVVRHRERLTAQNAERLVTGYDLVLDGSDNFPTRYLVNDACVLAGKPWVWGAVLRFDGHVATFWAQHGPQYRDLFPEPPVPGTVPSCGQAGVLGAVCAVVGSVMAAEAVKLITGCGRSLLGRVVVLDALSTTWRTLQLRPDPSRPPVTGLAEQPHACRAGTTEDLPVVTAAQLADRLRAREAGEEDFLLVDVREPDEHAASSIPGAVLVPLASILGGSGLADVPSDRPVVLHCAAGARSARALRALLDRGHADAVHLQGGVAAWTAARTDPGPAR